MTARGLGQPRPLLGGRFEARELLQRGAGIETWAGHDRDTGREVVVKIVGDAVSGGARQRIAQEASVLGQVRSERIAAVLAAGDDGGRLFLVTERLTGETLAARLGRGPLSLGEALAVGRCLLEALAVVHEHHVLHRDVKPANVVVRGEPIAAATLIDFGLAHGALDPAKGLRGAELAGTARYLAPEQAGLVHTEVDHRADLYATGVVLYECLAGQPPFVAETLGELLRLHLNAEPPPLGAVGGSARVPRALEALVWRLLRKAPRDRYQSAASALSDLEAIAGALALGEAPPEPAVDRARIELTEPTLVGRADELARLEALVARASGGEGALALLEGESGSGKSRLLQETARRAAALGVEVFWGQGTDRVALRPFQALEGAAAQLVGHLGEQGERAGELRRRLAPWREVLALVLPVLQGIVGEVRASGPTEEGPVFGEGASEAALFELVHALGGPGRPALLVLDDAQWLDDQTLALIAAWLRRPPPDGEGRHVTVVVAFRGEEVGGSHPLRGLEPELEPDARVAIGPLPPAELRRLLLAMAGALPEPVLATVARLAAGNPFMASSILWGLWEAGQLCAEQGRWKLLPGALSAVRTSHRAGALLGQRLGALPAEVRELLAVGAVLGRAFELDELAAVSSTEPGRCLEALHEARRRHLVWSDGSGARWQLVHDKLREQLLSGLADDRARTLHRRAAERELGPRAAGSRVDDYAVAYHFDAAGEPGRALPHALRAARVARRSHALDVAERQYRIARRAVEAGGVARAVRMRIAEGLGEVLMMRDRHDEARGELERALSLASERLDRARILGHLGHMAFRGGDSQRSARLLSEALGLLGESLPTRRAQLAARFVSEGAIQVLHLLFPERLLGKQNPDDAVELSLAGELYTRLAYAHWFHLNTSHAMLAHLCRLNRAERFAPSADLAWAWSIDAVVLSAISLAGPARARVRRALSLARELGDPLSEGMALHQTGVTEYINGHYREALASVESALPLLRRCGESWEVISDLVHVGFGRYRLGELREAAVVGREMVALSRSLGGQPLLEAGGLWLLVMAEDGRLASDLVERLAWHLDQPVVDGVRASVVKQAEAVRLLRQGDAARAVALLEADRRFCRDNGLFQDYVLPTNGWLATALRLQARAPGVDRRQAKRLLARAAAAARRACLIGWRFPNHRPHAWRERGLVAAARGEVRAARRHLDHALEAARALEARYEAAQTLLARGRLGQALGWPGAADDQAQALAELAAIGSDFACGEAVAELALAAADDDAPPTTLSIVDRFEALLEAGRRIVTAPDRQAVLTATLEGARTLLRPRKSALLELDGATPRVIAGDAELSCSRSLIQRAVAADRPVVEASALARPPTDESLLLSGARQALVAPVSVSGRPRYCLYLTHDEVSALFGDEERRVARFVCVAAEAALQNVAAQAERQRTHDELGVAYAQLEAAQDQLVQAARLAAIGELGAGIVHDLGQPVASIQGFAERLLRRGDDPIDRWADELEVILKAARRMARMLDNVRVFSRAAEASITRARIDPLEPLHEALALIERQLQDHGVTLERELSDLPEVEGDPQRLQQAFLNLLINARDALEVLGAGSPRRLALRASRDGDRVRVTVADSGPGVAVEHRGRIFDPFFTTKPVGKGTGLGLSISAGIVAEHGGSLTHAPTPGGGATFTVSLPVAGA